MCGDGSSPNARNLSGLGIAKKAYKVLFNLLEARIFNMLAADPQRLENLIDASEDGPIIIDEIQKHAYRVASGCKRAIKGAPHLDRG